MLTDSDLCKELARLANSKTPKNDKTIITDKLWERITHEITFIYPTFYTYVYSLCPNLSEQEWRYCCLYMFAFDSNEEAKLLNIMPDSVKTKHSRLRQKLNITLPPKSSLYEHFINNIGWYSSTLTRFLTLSLLEYTNISQIADYQHKHVNLKTYIFLILYSPSH